MHRMTIFPKFDRIGIHLFVYFYLFILFIFPFFDLESESNYPLGEMVMCSKENSWLADLKKRLMKEVS